MTNTNKKSKSSDKRRKIRARARLQPTNARDACGTLARERDATELEPAIEDEEIEK